MPFDRTVYFDSVRHSLFSGSMDQRQVDGQNAILDVWEWIPGKFPDIALDLRWLAYMLATAFHETSQAMWPIAEYHGEDQPYGQPDEDGKCWYGRGLVQLTHKDNYERARDELGLEGTPQDCVEDPDQQLVPEVASRTMFKGMYEGWFRSDEDGPQTLPRYFNGKADDPYGAREIINGDKATVPSWSHGVSIGKLIEDYHDHFLDALEAAWSEDEDEPDVKPTVIGISIDPEPAAIKVFINGKEYEAA